MPKLSTFQVEKETLFEAEMKKVREERQEMNLAAPRTRSPSLDGDMSSYRSHSNPTTAFSTPHGSPAVKRSLSSHLTLPSS